MPQSLNNLFVNNVGGSEIHFRRHKRSPLVHNTSLETPQQYLDSM